MPEGKEDHDVRSLAGPCFRQRAGRVDDWRASRLREPRVGKVVTFDQAILGG
jgi:hypothetical protein